MWLHIHDDSGIIEDLVCCSAVQKATTLHIKATNRAVPRNCVAIHIFFTNLYVPNIFCLDHAVSLVGECLEVASVDNAPQVNHRCCDHQQRQEHVGVGLHSAYL